MGVDEVEVEGVLEGIQVAMVEEEEEEGEEEGEAMNVVVMMVDAGNQVLLVF